MSLSSDGKNTFPELLKLSVVDIIDILIHITVIGYLKILFIFITILELR